jgi:hypothetical protein
LTAVGWSRQITTFTPAWAFLVFPLSKLQFCLFLLLSFWQARSIGCTENFGCSTVLVGIVAINVLAVFPLNDPRAITVLIVGYVRYLLPFSPTQTDPSPPSLWVQLTSSQPSPSPGLPRSRLLLHLCLSRHLRQSPSLPLPLFSHSPLRSLLNPLRFGPFVSLASPRDDNRLPRRASSQRCLRSLRSSRFHRPRHDQARPGVSRYPS